MTASLWQRLDQAYVDAIAAAMGRAGSYTDLVVQSVSVAATWAPDNGPRPAVIVVSDEADQQHGGHAGSAAIRLAVTYNYYAVAVAEAPNYATAKAAAQTLHQRLIAVLQTWPAILAAAAAAGAGSTETPIRQRWDRSWLDVRGRQSGGNGQHYAIAVVAWTVEGSA